MEANTDEPRFRLDALLKLNPCTGGLHAALNDLRKGRCMMVPAEISTKFWRDVSDLNPTVNMSYDERQQAITDALHDIKRVANRVFIKIDKNVLKNLLKNDANFRTYSSMIIKESGKSAFKNVVKKGLRNDIIEFMNVIERSKLSLYKQEIVQKQRELREIQAKINRANTGVSSVDSFDIDGLFAGDEYRFRLANRTTPHPQFNAMRSKVIELFVDTMHQVAGGGVVKSAPKKVSKKVLKKAVARSGR